MCRDRLQRVNIAARLICGMAQLVCAGVLFAAEPTAAELLFVRRVAPLLREKCIACHGQDERDIAGGLDLRTAKAMAAGGDSGEPAVRPGMPAASPLFLAAMRDSNVYSAMPPKEAERLNPEHLANLQSWIEAGAPWPNDTLIQHIQQTYAAQWSAEDGITVPTSGGQSAEWTNRTYKSEGLWAYQPVQRPQTSAINAAAIDELLARRRPAELKVAPPAAARAFIRRATFDLTGLPPSSADTTQFESDFAQDPDAAIGQLIDRLLASPHYGERMAQHWLDVVRYADSSGFANDYERGNAWRYRDYVIRAFNNDKPYNTFIREQIAGDEIAPDDPEHIIATGFLRMGPWELTGMEVAKVARQRFLDDVTNSVGETFLAHSLQCARCHDHKFDPIPTQDYYGIQAVFATTQIAERAADFLPFENRQGFEERQLLEQTKSEHSKALTQLDAVLLENAQQWYIDHGRDPAPWNAAVAAVRDELSAGNRRQFSNIFAQARNRMAASSANEEEYPPKFVGFTPEQFGRERVARKGLERLNWEFDRYQPFALAVYSGRTRQVTSVTAPVRMPANRYDVGELERTCILPGGDPFAAGVPVQPGVLSVLANIAPARFTQELEGRRTQFADWVAHPDNVLTTRAIVNRVWMWHFGRPLAGNPNNFGSTGKRPTDPELLDWLAATFVAEGWSFKALHRQIMLSAAYRQSTEHPHRDQLLKLDPLGTSYSAYQPRRLTAEELRDAMLVATGELNPILGGIPNRPEINLEVALQPRMVMGTFAAAWVPNSLPTQRHRRSIYALKLRGLSDPAMEVFNAPGPDFSCEQRDVSSITPQVFALFNSQASYARALALAARAVRDSGDSHADATTVLTRCFVLSLGRLPTHTELARCQEHWLEMQELHDQISVTLTPQPRQVIRVAVEENTGEKFSFEETLHANAAYVPDLQPADCDARTRGLADICLVLLNSNEFVYVY